MSLGRLIDLLARLLMSLLFLLSGFSTLAGNDAIEHYMQAYGVPSVLFWPGAIREISGGMLLLVGWCSLTAVIFHTALSDQNQMTSFFKKMTMVDGFLLIARAHLMALSVGAWRLGWTSSPIQAHSVLRGGIS